MSELFGVWSLIVLVVSIAAYGCWHVAGAPSWQDVRRFFRSGSA
ncbi:MAG TPA: hypothetical protein VMC43_02360 [Candidatus Paceibacterota bacterium]|nr:hypothetical protein [Candidatus Paceibacterota bacterium]